MTIRITKTDAGYQVAVTPPEAPAWKSGHPLAATEVLEQLSTIGCHATDIADALYLADPGWTTAHDEEVQRRRTR
jgi:hypothetical protein